MYEAEFWGTWNVQTLPYFSYDVLDIFIYRFLEIFM